MRRKLLFLTDHWTIGGRERSLKTILENLSDEWDCELLILRRIRTKIEEEKWGCLPFPQNIKVTKIERASIIPLFFSFIKFLKHRKPHLISTHITPTGNLLLLVYLAKKLARLSTPIVVTNHDTLEFPVDEFITFPFRKYVLRKKIDCLITISEGLGRVAEKLWKIPKEKVVTIYNPIVGEELFKNLFEPGEYKAFPSTIKIITVARLDLDTKDFVTLLQAFSLFKRMKAGAKLFILGDGPDKEKIQQLVDELGLQDSVFLLGSRLNPYPYIKYADVLVHSSFVEGLGRVIVEAMALGCPVVATDCPIGPRELIGNNENGVLIVMRDPAEMAEGMRKVVEDEEFRKRIIENGRRKAQEFLVSTSVKKREELFSRLISQKLISRE